MLCKKGFRAHTFLQIFQYIFYPRENNQKSNSLAVAASLFNTKYSQGQGTYHVKTIFQPSVPDSQEHLQVYVLKIESKTK
jgi:hypothetical protein